MAVIFRCPGCGHDARIVTGGYVEAHEARAGVACEFTRTPGSDSVPRRVEPTPDGAELLARRRAALETIHEARRVADEKPVDAEAAAKRERKKAKSRKAVKRSVWTTSGGLPTLGRR